MRAPVTCSWLLQSAVASRCAPRDVWPAEEAVSRGIAMWSLVGRWLVVGVSVATAVPVHAAVSSSSVGGDPALMGFAQSDPLGEPAPEPARERYGVQVASQRSEGDARTAYKALQSAYPALLATRSPMILRADTGEHGIVYRAVIGPFDTAAAASDFCAQFKTAGGMCVVQRLSVDAGSKRSKK